MKHRYLTMMDLLIENGTLGLSIEEFAQLSGVTVRTIYNDLNVMKQMLSATEVRIVSMDKKRIQLLGTKQAIQEARKEMAFDLIYSQIENDPSVRNGKMAVDLLLATEPITLGSLADKYYLSKSSVSKSVKNIERNLPDDLSIERSQQGLMVQGSLISKRKMAINLLENIINTLPNSKKVTDTLNNILTDNLCSEVALIINQVAYHHEIYLSKELQTGLLLHICIMIQSMGEVNVREKYQLDLSGFCQDLVSKVEEKLNVSIDADNCEYLQNYLVTMGIQPQTKTPIKLTDDNIEAQIFVKEFLTNLNGVFLFDFTQDQQFVNRLTLHCTAMFNRLKAGKCVDLSLASEIKNQYPIIFNVVNFLFLELVDSSYKNVSLEEIALLTVYIQAALEQKVYYKRIWIVCSEGLIFSELIKKKIQNYFPKIEVLRTLSIEEAQNILAKEDVDIDFIVSTKKFEASVPVIEISSIPDLIDITHIKHAVQHDHVKVNELFTENNILIKLKQKLDNQELIIRSMCQLLIDKGFVTTDFTDSVLAREAQLSTSLSTGVALPHGTMKAVKENALVIVTLENPILWGSQFVDCIVLIAFGEKEWNQNKIRLKQLYEIISNETNLAELRKANTSKEINEIFNYLVD